MRVARLTLGFVAGAALALAAAALAWADVPTHEPDDMALGSPRAPVTVIEYASVGCPHCAAWNNTIFPAFKAKYILTGRVRYVVREMITGSPEVATAGFMIARCAAPAKYFTVIDDVYRRQAEMFVSGPAAGQVLKEIAKSAGLDETAFEACLDDQKGLDALNARTTRNGQSVASTPTFFVNGRQVPEGEHTLAQLGAAIQAARPIR